LLIFDFEWKNGAPEQAVFEKLMKNAGSVSINKQNLLPVNIQKFSFKRIK